MATPRLSFLYPNFLRAVRACEPTTHRSLRSPPAVKSRKAAFHTTARRPQEVIVQRYGQAATQNLPPPGKPGEEVVQTDKDPEQQTEASPSNAEAAKEDKSSSSNHTDNDQGVGQDDPQDSNTTSDFVDEHEASFSRTKQQNQAKAEEQTPLGNKELDMVLSVPSPSEVKGRDSSRHPHMEPSPYEHHFDTYGLVQQLASAYTEQQAITVMKAIRLMLALNLDVAKEGLVSKSDIENESYLFRAAISELRTTLQTARHSEAEAQRSQRAQLQHENDILNQKVTQDLLTLREDLKGLFNDRKLGLQEDKRKIDSKIQELNYEITVLLNSEAKGEVEGLRWVLTRRAAFAIGVCACKKSSSLPHSPPTILVIPPSLSPLLSPPFLPLSLPLLPYKQPFLGSSYYKSLDQPF